MISEIIFSYETILTKVDYFLLRFYHTTISVNLRVDLKMIHSCCYAWYKTSCGLLHAVELHNSINKSCILP